MIQRVALLRAVNVSGTNKLPMADLRAMAEGLGLNQVRTHIASGNLLFASNATEGELKAMLEARIAEHMGKAVPVYIRAADEMVAIVSANPFPDALGSRHMVFFFDDSPAPDTIELARDRQGERIALARREIHVDYADNIRNTRLKLPQKGEGTGRNMNTVRKLAELLSS